MTLAVQRLKKAMKWLVRVMLGLTGLYLVVFAAVFAVLNSTQVQNRLIPYVNQELSKVLKTKVRVGRVSIELFDRIVLEDLYWEDQRHVPMITAKKLTISVISMPTLALLASSDRPKRFFARTVELDSAYLNLYIDKAGGGLNIEKVINALSDSTKIDTSTAPPPKLVFDFPSIQIRDMRFHLTDSATKDYAMHLPVLNRFNFQNLRMKDLQLHAGLKIDENANIFFSCYDLHAYDTNSKLTLKHFSTRFLSVEKIKEDGDTVRNVRFYDTRVKIGQTDLYFDLKMPGMTFSRLFKSGYNRNFTATFDNSLLDFASINYFVPEPIPLQGMVKISGSVQGDYHRLRAKDLSLIYNDSTRILADAKIDDYTEGEDKMMMKFKVRNTYVRVKDFEKLLPTVKLPEQVRNIGSVLMDGSFTGFVRDFVAQAKFQTPLGKVESDVNLKFGDKAEDFEYKGYCKTTDFNLDRLLNIKVSDKLNFAGKVEGKSTDFNTASGKYVFKLRTSRFMGYEVDSCVGAIEMNQKIIKGALKINDAQGSFAGDVEADFSARMPVFGFSGALSAFDLKHYAVTDRPYLFTSELSGVLKGDSLDNLNGNATFDTLFFTNAVTGQHLKVKNLNIITDGNSIYNKNIQITGSDFDLTVLGNWSYNNIVQIANTIVKEIIFEVEGDTAGLKQYLKDKNPVPATLALQFRAKRINPIFSFFEIPIYADDTTTRLDVDLDFDDNQFISVKLHSDSISAGPVSATMLKSQFDLRAPALTENYTFTLDGDVESKAFTIDNAVTFPNLDFHPRLERNELSYNIRTGIDTVGNYIYLEGNGTIEDKALNLHIFPQKSRLMLKDSLFTFTDSNSIYFKDQVLKIKNLRLFNQHRELVIESDIDPPNSDLLSLQLRNIELELLHKIVDIGIDLQGNVEMEADIFQLFKKPIIRANGNIQNIAINGLHMGNLTTQTNLGEENHLNAEVKWVREKDEILNLNGYYDLNDSLKPLHFTLNGVGFPLKVFEKFLSDAVYDLSGTALFNQIKIEGDISKPVIEGDILADARLGLTFLKQKFAFKDRINVQSDRFTLKDFRVFNVDAKTGKEKTFQYADFNGELTHQNFDHIKFRIGIENMKRFQLMQTQEQDNSVFYGTGIVEGGQLSVSGDFENIKIQTVGLKPSKGTVVNIPVTNYEKKERLNFVKFVNHSKAVQEASTPVEEEKNLFIELDMDVDMTPDAEVNIIFDKRIGDKISARGNGHLLLTMNRDAEFAMSGKYEIEKGSYLFTFKDLLNKSFEIANGGYLRWTGDPFNATIDLNAVYQVNANMKAWDTTLSNTRVNVNMNMSGTLQQPDIKFSLEIPGVAQSNSPGIAYTMRQIQADQQELNRQVFSLILLNSVAPIGRFFGQSTGDAASSGATSTLTEFLSNQLNSIIAQTISDNIGINVNLNRDQIMLTVRATLFNDRVTFERNGALTSGQNRDVTIGNISVQFRILPGEKGTASKTGILAAEVFNRESFLSQNINAGSSTRGVGLFYRKEFDILKKNKKKKKANAEKKARKQIKKAP